MYKNKTKLFTISGSDILELTKILDIAPDTRGWKNAVQFVNLNIGEVRCCELGGGARPFIDLLCQRGWTVGKMIDLCTKLGNQSAVDLLNSKLEEDSSKDTELCIVGDRAFSVGESIKLCAHAPPKYYDVQWYFEKSCLRAEKSRYLTINQITTEHSGRYKLRLEANSSDIKWLMVDVTVLEKGRINNDLEFILQPQDFILQRTGGDVHFFVDVRPIDAHLQWYCNGVAIPNASQQYLIVPQQDHSSHRKQYKCTAQAGTNTITSNTALIRWIPNEPKVFDSATLLERATDKVALVIGNQCYREPTFSDILHAEDDARDIALSLRELNFKVVSLINLKLLELHVACENFYKLLSTGVYGVFYFAGHGFEYGGENYLMPIDAPENVKVEHCMKAQLVLHRMQFRETKLNLLLLDMCRDQFPNVGLTHDLQPIQSFGNTAIGFACGPGLRAYGSENDKNGIYVKYLKEHITRHISVTTLLDTVNRAIGTKEPNIDQRPHYQSSLISNISLTDNIDPTNHTVEYHHRAQIWHSANNVDKTQEEVSDGPVKLSVTYTAHFSNVLIITIQSANTVHSVTLDPNSESDGLILNDLEEGRLEIRNLQRLTQPQIILIVRVDDGTDIPVIINRPLFSKISAVNNAGSMFDVDVYGSQRVGCQAVPAVQGRCIDEQNSLDDSLDDMKENKEVMRKIFEDKEKIREEKKDIEFHQPLLISDHPSEMVYPYVAVYLLPQINSAELSPLSELEHCIIEEGNRTHRSHQLSLVEINTFIVGHHDRPWIEVVLTDTEYKESTRAMLEGRSWHNSHFKYSTHIISILNMLETFSSQNTKCSELWVTDGPMWQQIVPHDGILAECNPVNIPIA